MTTFQKQELQLNNLKYLQKMEHHQSTEPFEEQAQCHLQILTQTIKSGDISLSRL